jgi:hypothetical protein
MRLIRILVSLALAGGVAAAVGSAATASAPTNTGLPSIGGTMRDGQLLTAHNGAWTGSPTSFAYDWQRCDDQGGGCTAIAGATSKDYTASSADVGHRLRVQVTASNADGNGSATSRPTDVIRATGAAPANTRPPSLSGAAQQGATLRVDRGRWSGTTPIKYDYTWQRCDTSGNNCITFIAHDAGAVSYTLGVADVGHTMRVEVLATNTHGSSYVYTRPTAVVTAPTPPATSIAVARVSLPNRLVIDRVGFSPNPVRSRNTPIVTRFHVADTNGLSVEGALVFALGLPYGWTYNAPERPTDGSGWATITIQPTRNMPLVRGDLVLFVRARKPGDSLLAGVSTRRLVQEGIR